MDFTYIFGPVASSRLGLSLGLDLLGQRVCSMDCLYCEVGRTDNLTLARAPYVSADVLLAELTRWKNEQHATPDHITLGGAGEPCLNSELGKIIDGCHFLFPQIPVAVLTNGTLLSDDAVCAELRKADVVLPSMDSLVEEEFLQLNRPCGGLNAAQIAEDLLAFNKTYDGKIFLEILLVKGINDSEENQALLHDFVRRLTPDRVDVTTLSRPGAYPVAKPVAKDVKKAWCDALNSCIGSEFPGTVFFRTGQRADLVERDLEAATDMVLRSLQRRPQMPSQLAMALSLPLEKVEAVIEILLLHKTIYCSENKDSTFADAQEPFYTCQ